MPIYEYECKSCGVFEVTQKITESPLRVCPMCDSCVPKRLVSSTGSPILKGTGWYATDYKKKQTGVKE